MLGRKSVRVFNPVAKIASLKSSGPRLALNQHKLLVTTANEVEKKAHKRNPFKQQYVELCLSAFPQTAEEEEACAEGGRPDLAISCCLVNDAAANLHVRTELIRTMKLALVKQTAEAAKQCECKAVKRAKVRHQKAATTDNEPMLDTGAFFQPQLLDAYERTLAGEAPAVLIADEARQNPNLREPDQLNLGPDALKQRKSVCDFIDGLFADGNPLTKGIEDGGLDEVVDNQQTADVVMAILRMSPDTTLEGIDCSQESDWAALESGGSCIASLLAGSKVWLPPYLRGAPQDPADQFNSVAKSGPSSPQIQRLRKCLDASRGQGAIELLDGIPGPSTQQIQGSPERRRHRQPCHEEASFASLSICNVASSAALDAVLVGRSSPSAHAASRPSGWKPSAQHAGEAGVHGSACLGLEDGEGELLQSGTRVQQPVQPPSTSNGSSAPDLEPPDQSGVLDIDFVPDSDPDSESATSMSEAAGSLLIGPPHTVEGEVADLHHGRKLHLPVLRRRRHMGFDAAAEASSPAQEHLTSGIEAVEESSNEADDPPHTGDNPAICSEAVSKRKVPVLARKKFAALRITATAQEDEPDGTEGAGAGQRAPKDSAAARVIGSKKRAPETAEGKHWHSATITPDFTPASLLALLPTELLRSRPGQKPRYRPVHDPEALLLKLPAMHRQPANKTTPHQQEPQQHSSPLGAPQHLMAAPISQHGAGTPTQLPVKQEQPLMPQTDHSAAGAGVLETTQKWLLQDDLEAGTGVFALEEDGDDLLPIVFNDGSRENLERSMANPLHRPPDSLAQPVSLQHGAHPTQNAAQQPGAGSGRSLANLFQNQGVFAEASQGPSEGAQSAAECWWGAGRAGVQWTGGGQQREAPKVAPMVRPGQGLPGCSLVFMDQQPGSLQLPCRPPGQPQQPPQECSYTAAGCSAQPAPGTSREEQSVPAFQQAAQLSWPPDGGGRNPAAKEQTAQRLMDLDPRCPIVFLEDEAQSCQQGEPLIEPPAPKHAQVAVIGLDASSGGIGPAELDTGLSTGQQPTITCCQQLAKSEREAAEPQWGPLQPARLPQSTGGTGTCRVVDSPAASMSVDLSYLDYVPQERLPPTACMSSSDAGTIEGFGQECVITFPEAADTSQNCNVWHSHTQNLDQQLLVNSPRISDTTAREPQWECQIIYAQDSQPEPAPSRCAGPARSPQIRDIGSDALKQRKQAPWKKLPAAAGEVESAAQGQAVTHDTETGQQINDGLPRSLGAAEGPAADAEPRLTDVGDLGMRGASKPSAPAGAEPSANDTAATCDPATVSPARRAQATAPDLPNAKAMSAAGQTIHSQVKAAATGRRKRSKEELYDFYRKEALGETSVGTRQDAMTGMVMARLDNLCTSAAPVTLSELRQSGQGQTMSGSDALPQRCLMALLTVVHQHNTGQKPLSSGRQQQLRLVASLNHTDCFVEVNGSEIGVDHLQTDLG